MGSAVGLLMFLQTWYWYPLFPFLSLCFTPTMLIGLNKDFDMPTDFETICSAPPSMFSYHKAEVKKEDEKKVVTTAILSTTARAKFREAKKEAKKLGRQPSHDSMEGIPLERVPSHVSTTSYLSIEPVSHYLLYDCSLN
jgi:26S proteasome regulatory subunit N2